MFAIERIGPVPTAIAPATAVVFVMLPVIVQTNSVEVSVDLNDKPPAFAFTSLVLDNVMLPFVCLISAFDPAIVD